MPTVEGELVNIDLDKAVKLCVPGGIGDISWIYSKIWALKQALKREVVMYVASETPKRGGDFVQLLPEVHFGGYLDDRPSTLVMMQSIPGDWSPPNGGLGFFHKPWILNISANTHLELGHPIRDWIPLLPINYHYPLSIPSDQEQEAAKIIAACSSPTICVYVANRSKQKEVHGGWDLWSTEEWCHVLKTMGSWQDCHGCTFLITGAEYDRDRCDDVADDLRSHRYQVVEVVGRPLGVALECLRRCHYFLSYPSGIGILANVLRTPGIMLLPWQLEGLQRSYADPEDLGYKKYRAWADPDPEDALRWLWKIGRIWIRFRKEEFGR